MVLWSAQAQNQLVGCFLVRLLVPLPAWHCMTAPSMSTDSGSPTSSDIGPLFNFSAFPREDFIESRFRVSGLAVSPEERYAFRGQQFCLVRKHGRVLRVGGQVRGADGFAFLDAAVG